MFYREVFNVEIETLPTPDTKEPPLCCDSCTRKGMDNQLAVVYCTTCSTKLCAKHREVCCSVSYMISCEIKSK